MNPETTRPEPAGNPVKCLSQNIQEIDVPVLYVSAADSTNIGCHASQNMRWFVTPDDFARVSAQLHDKGFNQSLSGNVNMPVHTKHFCGSCALCGVSATLQIDTGLIIGDGTSSPMLINFSRMLFANINTTRNAGAVASALDVMSLTCTAALASAYRVGVRRELLIKANNAFATCSSDDLSRVSAPLIGQDAAAIVQALMQTSVQWEIDILLVELRRELRLLEDNNLQAPNHLKRFLSWLRKDKTNMIILRENPGWLGTVE